MVYSDTDAKLLDSAPKTPWQLSLDFMIFSTGQYSTSIAIYQLVRIDELPEKFRPIDKLGTTPPIYLFRGGFSVGRQIQFTQIYLGI